MIDSFNETLPAFLLRLNWSVIFILASSRKFNAIVVSFLSLLLTFVDDMFDGNMDTLVECHNFHLSLVEQKLDCRQMFYKRSQTMNGTFHTDM